MDIQRGFRDSLSKYLDASQPFTVRLGVSGSGVYDYSCFGVDGNNKLSDDRYMVFYNQTRSPNNEITYSPTGVFTVDLAGLPEEISRLVFTVSIDGAGTMGEISSHSASITHGSYESLTLTLGGSDFRTERAIISLELYRKDSDWRISATASGFNGGLPELLRHYGGQEQPAPNGEKVSLEKKLAQNAPKLVSLAKPLTAELRKRNLEALTARAALVLDISGSMSKRYSDGTVQEIVNKTLPLAVQFDDDGELDFWYYGTTCRRMDSVNMSNYERAVPPDWKSLMRSIGGQTNAAEVMQEIISEYSGSRTPAYVLFITDGGFTSEGRVKKLIAEASREAIFWQFVGVGGKLGGRGYGILERLDGMGGRFVDNANFFTLDDFKTVETQELYGRLLNEFPKWLNEARQKGVIS